MKRFCRLSMLVCALSALPATAAPTIHDVEVVNVSPQSLSLVYGASEAVTADVGVYSDAAGQRPVTSVEINTAPFRSSDVRSAAASRGLGMVRIHGLSPGVTYYLKLTLTTGSGSNTTWPSSGVQAVTTASGMTLEPGQPFLPGVVIRSPWLPSGADMSGALSLLEVDGALAPLASFIGDGSPSTDASFDLTNLFAASDGYTMNAAQWTPVVLTRYTSAADVARRGYVLPASGQTVGTASLVPYVQTLSFNPGWNYFALLLEPDDRSADVVLQEVWSNVVALWCWTGSTWTEYGATSGFTELTPLRGCAVELSAGGEVEIQGPKWLDPLELPSGWSAVAFSIDGPTDIATVLEPALGGALEAVWKYAGGDTWYGWEADLPAAYNTLSQIDPGGVYFVSLKTAATLEVQ